MSSGGDSPEFVPPDGFDPPRWLGRGQRRHIPEPYWTWEIALERSRNVAVYHPSLPLADIETLEMDTVRDEIRNRGKSQAALAERIVDESDELLARVKANRPRCICVYYDHRGNVHGFPVTQEEIKRREAKR